MDAAALLSEGIVVFTKSIIKPTSWQTFGTRGMPFTSGSAIAITSLVVVLPLIIWALQAFHKMQEAKRKPFRFLELPQELRDMVYENLLEEPDYPAPSPTLQRGSSIEWIMPKRWSSNSDSSPATHKSNWIFLANKQVYQEYMDMLSKRATFHLTVSPENWQSPVDKSNATDSQDNRIWKISRTTLKQLRTCSLKLITTSSMLGVTDPRNMTLSDWTLACQIRQELKCIGNVTNLTLDAKAISDPLWNPIWIWYHASQSFKTMGTEDSETGPVGPRVSRITFSLDTWSPGENYMQRDDSCEGRWTWYCMEKHSVGLDLGPEMTVREFLGKLYQECKLCRPETATEEMEEEEED
ncbi:hypothetical protein ACN47E_006561 [Coniothyrium glycines]